MKGFIIHRDLIEKIRHVIKKIYFTFEIIPVPFFPSRAAHISTAMILAGIKERHLMVRSLLVCIIHETQMLMHSCNCVRKSVNL